jgi:hypothetical protein
MGELSKSKLARLAFWSANMNAVRESNWSWPGFGYTEAEWALMKEFAKPVSGGSYIKFILLNAVIFVVFAGVVVVCAFLPVLLLLYPDTRDLQPLPFTLLLAATAFLTIGFGLPFSMRIAAWLCASNDLRASLRTTPEIELLDARVSWQLMRMTLIMCGILVPGMLLWITLNIDGGPVLTTLKFILAALFIGSTAAAALRRKSS